MKSNKFILKLLLSAKNVLPSLITPVFILVRQYFQNNEAKFLLAFDFPFGRRPPFGSGRLSGQQYKKRGRVKTKVVRFAQKSHKSIQNLSSCLSGLLICIDL